MATRSGRIEKELLPLHASGASVPTSELFARGERIVFYSGSQSHSDKYRPVLANSCMVKGINVILFKC